MRPRIILTASAVAIAAFLSTAATPSAQQVDPRVMQRMFPACVRNPVPDDHTFVAVNLYQGDTLANVLIGSESSQSTIVRVNVRPGDKPMSVFVIGHSGLIWDFEGDVGHVHRVIAMSTNKDGRVAVRGIPSDRVEFTEMPRCEFSLSAHRSEDLETQKLTLSTVFGHRPDVSLYEYAAHELVLPAGAWRREPERASGIRPLRFYPGGFRELDPKTLVSPVAITVPETAPDQAGLMQLEQSGAIRRPRPQEVMDWIEGASTPYRSKLSPNYRLRVAFDYVVTRDIMLPAGLNGAHSQKFLVLSGVPAPRGHPGHSCVVHMDGFRVSNAMLCHGEERSAVDLLKVLPPAESLAACRILDAPADAAFEAVSAYEPDGAQHSGGSKRVAAPIAVRVLKPGNVVLVLNSYEPAVWQVSFSPDTRVVGALLSGYYTSSVEGLHPDTPVVMAGYEGRQQRAKPDPACARFYDYLGTAYDGGPDALVLDRQVQALTGRSLDGLRGAYKLKAAEIR
jgi:hypothetical protein